MRKPSFKIALAIILAIALSACDSSNETKNSEEQNTIEVAILLRVPVAFDPIAEAFEAKMDELGYEQGDNFEVFITYSQEDLAEVAATTSLDLAIAIPGGYGDNSALLQAYNTVGEDIPILFVPASTDMTRVGLVESLEHPARNISGIMLTNNDERRLELFLQMLPNPQRIYMPYNPLDDSAQAQLEEIEMFADAYGVELIKAPIPQDSLEDAEIAINNMPADVDGIFLFKVWLTQPQWYRLGIERGIPVSQDGFDSINNDHPLMAYGPSMQAMGEQVAVMANRVLGGTFVGDLPVESAEFFLTIDVGIAAAIELDLSEEVLLTADVIERSTISVETDAAPTELEFESGDGACTAQAISPGGRNFVCATAPCEVLPTSGAIRYEDTNDVSACTTTELVGICTTDALSLYYYEGDAATLALGCGFSSGTWEEAEN